MQTKGKPVNKPILILGMFILTGCATLSKEAVEAQRLTQSPDLIEALRIYTGTNPTYCKEYCATRSWWCQTDCERDSKDALAFKDQSINYECLDKSEYQIYRTDECILYRRGVRTSQINYFDFGRFIPQDSHIKTEDDFVAVSNKFRSLKSKLEACQSQKEKTTAEKNACQDALLGPIIRFSEHGIQPCKEVLSTEYQAMLKSQVSWFEWATHHDPKENIKTCLDAYRPLVSQLSALGQMYSARQIASYCTNMPEAPIYSEGEAIKKIQETVERFGNDNFCDTNDHKTELKKLGLKI